MMQIPYVPLKNTKQLATKLQLAEGERTELAMNIRTDDGMTNGASNIVKLVQLNQQKCPLQLFGYNLTRMMWGDKPDTRTGLYTGNPSYMDTNKSSH